MEQKFNIIGIMSGTSLDGIDISYCTYNQENNKNWGFNLIKAKTYKHTTYIHSKLSEATELNTISLIQLDKELGIYIANLINQFIEEFNINRKDINAIASHGHTIYHAPKEMYTLQIGCGTTISIHTQLPVINDFRSKDVALGGQGAPLVPIGDQLLFKNQADGFLNIGGISNISLQENNETIAFDICPGNLPSNYLMKTISKEYDENGNEASKGKLNSLLLEKLNSIEFYKKTPPKSLGIEWLNENFFPIINNTNDSLQNKLFTINEHIAIQISEIVNKYNIKKLLITGGGAYNTFLVDHIKIHSNAEIIIPDSSIIEFKEAIIFGLLGALYLAKEINCLSSVTGATRNSCGGVLHLPN